MTHKLHVGMYQPPLGRPCWHTTRDAAAATGLSVATIRRALRSHGARVGRSVGGMVEISHDGVIGFVPVSLL